MLHPEPAMSNKYLIKHIKNLTRSFKHLVGKALIENKSNSPDFALQIFEAPFVVVSQDCCPDPIFTYSNKKGLALFELTWDELVKLPSKYSAEANLREEREKHLAEVQANGYTMNYTATRISKTGKRFKIIDAIIWNVSDEDGKQIGQAATFKEFVYI